ncbi:hypothetical protein PSTT_02871 [Puccinia striiformis]|uniref:TRP C-terminal domain-containing protein n=1 Tax=Puccinia striiformis TaxID=27350 RepID=A0A2S4VY03_9BASI|nr:hypothetical protein PSTT_02871 [Puccinia striiformis]
MTKSARNNHIDDQWNTTITTTTAIDYQNRSHSSNHSLHAISTLKHSSTIRATHNFNRLWTQLDPATHTLRMSALAQVASQSTGYSSQTNFLATLISQTSILNFQSFSNQSALCSSIRTPNSNNNNNSSGCPYGPGEIGLGVQLPLSSQHTDYPFLTLSTQLQLLDTSTPALTLGCIEIDTSPYYPAHLYFKLLRWIPIAILIGYIIILDSWLKRYLNFIQFISILGLYSVQWPEFIYPIFTQSAWSTLVFNTTLGIPRWSTTIGISPQDLFGVSISIFFLCCSAVAFLSVLAYLIALLSTFISSKVNPHTNTDSAPNERDSVIFSSYQLTLINIASRLSFGISVIVIIGTILIPSIQLYRLKKCSSSIESIRNHQGGTGGEELIDNPIRILSLGPIYNTYDHKNVLYMTVKFCSQFTIGVSIGTAQNQPIIMAVILLIVELTETMLTSLWLPWGDGAAMAPLTFIISVSRIVTAVILVVLTPTVAVGSVASGWLGYVVLLILGGVLGILLLVLVVKFIELILRLVAHIPFDETRSTRAGGLRGAWRRWDRSISRSSRHGRAAEITAKRQRRARRKSKQQTRRASIFSALNDQSPAHHHHHHHQQQQQHHQHLDNHSPYGPTPPSLSPGFVTMNDEDGNIMSAMSQGAWVRTPGGSEPMFTNNSNNLARFPVSGGGRIGGSSSLTPPDPYPSSSGPPTSSSSGFAVVRGGRATEKTPYQMHNDGRNSWRPQPRPQQQQQGLGVTSSPLNNHHYHDYPPNSNTRFGHQQSARLGVQNGFFEPNHLNTTTNLFENSGSNNTATPYHHNLSNSSDHDGSINRMNSSNRRRRKGKKNGKKKSSAGAGGIFNFFSSSRDNNKDDDDGSSSSSSESSSSDEDDDWDDESGSEEEEDERSRTGRKKLKGLIGGLDKWRKTKIDPLNHASSSEVPDSHLGNEPIDLHLTGGAGGAGGGFQVLRQPRLKPSPVGSSVSNPAVLDKSTPIVFV